MREFIRHPIAIPIDVSVDSEYADNGMPQTVDLSIGGLAFRAARKIDPGSLVNIRIQFLQPEFETQAKVVWCRDCRHGVELGVQFLSEDDAFRTRMIEQVCHIENYRQNVLRKEGRQLNAQEAALEWVGRFAANFPDTGSDSVH